MVANIPLPGMEDLLSTPARKTATALANRAQGPKGAPSSPSLSGYRQVPPGDRQRVIPGYRVSGCPKCNAPYASANIPTHDGSGDVESTGYCTSYRCGEQH